MPEPPPPPPAGPSPYPTGTVAIVFTDIQGSTSLWEKLGDKFAPVLELHNRLMREALEERRGYEVKTVGDAFMIAFSDPLDAVMFAIEALESFSVTAWPQSVGDLMVRVGVHTGDPIVEVDPRSGRVDYFGPMVNCSARIESAAHGGQILIGRSTYDKVAGRLPGVELADLGEHRLKGIDSPERIYQVITPRLPQRDFPPIATITSLPTNLPYQLTSFVGREKEIAELSALISEGDSRLVTLSGPGGTGKTRLSLRIGNVMLDQFPGGVWVANLARARTVDDIASVVAQALGMQLAAEGEAPEKLVANVLEYRKPLLLIVDNFEQVVQHAPATIGLWMSRAPKAKFLVTSQSLLGLAGEREYRLNALAVPPRAGEDASLLAPRQQAAAATSYDSVRLFVERARDANPAFAINEYNAADIMTLCAELDGIPLALELAAARIRIMTPKQMVERLSQKFQLLRSSRRDIPERHQTLQAAIEWSYDLLLDWEKACFQQACVFRSGFSLEAAEAVIDLTAFPDAPFPMDAVQMLREKSFLATRETPFGVRFHLFRSMREFGEAKWKPTPELLERHAGYYSAYAREWDALRAGPRMLEALDRLDQKKEHVFAAVERMLELGRLETAAELALSIAGFLLIRGTGRQRIAVLESAHKAIEAASAGAGGGPPLRLRVLLMTALSKAHQSLGDHKRSEQLAYAALAAAETLPEGPELAESITAAALAKRRIGLLDEAVALHDRAERMYAACGDRAGLAFNLGTRALILISRRKTEAALDCLGRAEAINRELHIATGLIANLSNHGRLLRDQGDYEAALRCLSESEALCRQIGDAASCARVLGNRAITLQSMGELDKADGVHAQAEAIFRELGDKTNAARVEGNRATSLIGRGKFVEALACQDQALRVMRELDAKRSVASMCAGRSQVLRLLGRGAESLAAAEEAISIFRALGVVNSPDSFFAHAARATALAATRSTPEEGRRAARIALQLGGMCRVHEQPLINAYRVDLEELRRLATAQTPIG